jgi:hypothetical protein
MFAKILTGVGVLCLAVAVVFGVAPAAVSAAVTVAIALGGVILSVIGIFKKA